MIYLIILFAILARFIPHMSNAAPITALAIFGAIYLPKRQALVIPLAARFVSDIFLGFFAWPQMIAVYAAHLVGFGLGLWTKKSKANPLLLGGKTVFSAFVSAMAFFLITNFAFLYSTTQYAHNWGGITLAYYNGLPFLRGTLVGDVGYTVALIAAYEFARYFASKKHFSYK